MGWRRKEGAAPFETRMLALLQNCLCLLFPLASGPSPHTRQHVSGGGGPCILHPFQHPALNPSNAMFDTLHFVHTLDMDLISQIPKRDFSRGCSSSVEVYQASRTLAIFTFDLKPSFYQVINRGVLGSPWLGWIEKVSEFMSCMFESTRAKIQCVENLSSRLSLKNSHMKVDKSPIGHLSGTGKTRAAGSRGRSGLLLRQRQGTRRLHSRPTQWLVSWIGGNPVSRAVLELVTPLPSILEPHTTNVDRPPCFEAICLPWLVESM